MGLLKSGFMQPVEDTTPIEESEETNPGGATLISDIPDDAFGHVLFWLPPLTNLYSRPLYTTSTSLCMTRMRVGRYRFSSPSRGTLAKTKNAP